MGLAFEQAKEEIKRRTSIVSLIGEYVTLKKKGRDHLGLCPFHGEKTPSMHVHDAEGYYYCFGCQAKGDHYNFLMEHVGYSFFEAVTILAEQCGIELPKRDEDPKSTERRRERRETKERFTAVNEHAMAVFQHNLGSEALAYLRDKRRLTDETIERFALGFAPDSWDNLSVALEAGSFNTMRDALALGLIGQRREGRGHYDKFRHRIIFPLREPLRGKVVAFAGRTLSSDPDAPKYVNSSESEVFTKGRCLYGLFEAKKNIRETGKALVVEGQVDVLTLQQSGLSAVAPMGTALTQDQCDLLKRFAERVILVYDGDGAGRAAAVKAVPMVLSAGLNGTVVLLPDGEDPDTLVREQGPGALMALMERGKPLFEAYLEDAVAEFDGTAAGQAAVVERVAPVFRLLPSEVERDDARKKVAALLGALDSDVKRWLRPRQQSAPDRTFSDQTFSDQTFSDRHASTSVPQRRAPEPERQLLGLLLQHPQLIPFWRERSDDALTTPFIAEMVEHMVAIQDRNGQFEMLELLEWLSARGDERFSPHIMKLHKADLGFGADWQAAFVAIADHLEADALDRRRRAELVNSVQKHWSNV